MGTRVCFACVRVDTRVCFACVWILCVRACGYSRGTTRNSQVILVEEASLGLHHKTKIEPKRSIGLW